MPITSPGNDDDTGENHQPTLRKNTAEPVEQTLKQNNCDREVHKGRNMVERVFNRTKRYRKAATRYDRLDEAFLADLRLILIATYLKKHSQKPN